MKSTPVAEEGTFVFVSLSEAIAFLKRGLLPALALAALLAGAAWFIIGSRPAQFSAQALLLSVRPEAGSVLPGALAAPALDPAIYNLVLHQGPVLEWLLDDPEVSGLWTRSELGSVIRVLSEQTVQSTVIRVQTTGADPAAVAALANKAASALLRWDSSRSAEQLEQWVSSLTMSLIQLENELQGSAEDSVRQSILEERRSTKLNEVIGVASRLPASQLSLLQRARMPEVPDSSHRTSSSAIAAILAVIMVYALQLFQAAAWRTVAAWRFQLRPALREQKPSQSDHKP